MNSPDRVSSVKFEVLMYSAYLMSFALQLVYIICANGCGVVMNLLPALHLLATWVVGKLGLFC